MGEATEASDYIVVFSGVTQLIVVAERGGEQQRAILVGEILAVLERHVEEAAFLWLELIIIFAIDGRLGDRQGNVIRRELLGFVTEHVAGKLIEQDYGSERGQRIPGERIDGKLPFLRPELEEILLDAMVELGTAAPP